MADLFDRFQSDYGQPGGGQDWRQPRQHAIANPFEELEFTAAQSVSPLLEQLLTREANYWLFVRPLWLVLVKWIKKLIFSVETEVC